MVHIFSLSLNNKWAIEISMPGINNYYQGFISLINESIMENPQALIPPDTYKLGDSSKPVIEKSG